MRYVKPFATGQLLWKSPSIAIFLALVSLGAGLAEFLWIKALGYWQIDLTLFPLEFLNVYAFLAGPFFVIFFARLAWGIKDHQTAFTLREICRRPWNMWLRGLIVLLVGWVPLRLAFWIFKTAGIFLLKDTNFLASTAIFLVFFLLASLYLYFYMSRLFLFVFYFGILEDPFAQRKTIWKNFQKALKGSFIGGARYGEHFLFFSAQIFFLVILPLTVLFFLLFSLPVLSPFLIRFIFGAHTLSEEVKGFVGIGLMVVMFLLNFFFNAVSALGKGLLLRRIAELSEI